MRVFELTHGRFLASMSSDYCLVASSDGASNNRAENQNFRVRVLMGIYVGNGVDKLDGSGLGYGPKFRVPTRVGWI